MARLRNVKGSRETIESSKFVVNEPKEAKGKWSQIFGNNNPVHIEIGMGKGKFIMRQAALNPDINYIGIEMYSSVLVRGIEKARSLEEEGKDCSNFKFIRMDAQELRDVFETGEVSKIYLNFSDPWPKDRHAKRRLTADGFLSMYYELLEEGTSIEFKTDNVDLFDFSLESAKESQWELTKFTYDLYNEPEMIKGNVPTEYEEKFTAKGNKICKMILNK